MLELLRRYLKDRFAKKMMQAIAAAGGPDDFAYDREEFTLSRGDAVANLGNVYLAYRQTRGEHRQRVFANFVASFTEGKDTELSSFAEVESKLVAVVRERAFLAAMNGAPWGIKLGSEPKERPAHEPFSQWFSKAIVVDFPSHVMVVNDSHLKEWGVTFDEAFGIGLSRLRDSTAPNFRQENGYFVGAWKDDYDSSRVLLPSMFEDLPLNGDPVVVDSSSPIFHDVQRARKIAALVTYEDQKANLDHLYQKTKKDIFVASYKLTEGPSGEYTSYSVWSNGVATLLPETDVVMFFDENRPEENRVLGQAPWERVKTKLGDLMLDTQMFPTRHFVSNFPTAEQLRSLGIE